jgi:putative DNA primase/helicase
MDDKMDLERKGHQSYQGYLHVRIMVFGNGALNSLYDKSDGFYRRQIALRVKEKPVDRVDDRELSDKIALETEGIVLWCLEGLKRHANNGFHFTVSDRTRKNQAEMRREEDSIMDFLESDGYISFDEKAECTTRDLYEAYRLWGEDNLIKVRSETSFSKELRLRADKLGIVYMKNVSLDGKTARGYKGVYAVHTLKDCPFALDRGA